MKPICCVITAPKMGKMVKNERFSWKNWIKSILNSEGDP